LKIAANRIRRAFPVAHASRDTWFLEPDLEAGLCRTRPEVPGRRGCQRVRGEASDPGTRRYRPLQIIAEQFVDDASARDRAIWEANVRAGRSRRVTVVVRGWREL